MVNRGEERVWIQMNVVPRSTGNTNSGTRELTLKCKLKCYFKPMNNRDKDSQMSVLHNDIDPLHKWRLNLNNNTWCILSLALMFQDKGIFT